MARNISASVGRLGGVNRPLDVRTVQELLNEVPLASGGTLPRLDPDEICGPKTIRAIQKFQLHHFGFKGADGRVDPGQRTLAKLNEFDQTPRVEPCKIRMVGLTGDGVEINRPEQWFFEIRDLRGTRAVYHLGTPGEHKRFPKPRTFAGAVETFETNRSVLALATRGASYTTTFLNVDLPLEKVAFSTLNLAFLKESGGIEKLDILYPEHIVLTKSREKFPLRAGISKSASFQLVP
jgi:hypothetical protein